MAELRSGPCYSVLAGAALRDRKTAMRTLLNAPGDLLDEETRSLFYFSQERVEFS